MASKGKGRAFDPGHPQRSPLEALPFEIQQAILAHLVPAELVRVASTSRTLRAIALADLLWKEHVYDVAASSPPPRNPWITPFHAPPSAWQSAFQTPEAPPWPFPNDVPALASAFQHDSDAISHDDHPDFAHGAQYQQRGSGSTSRRRSSAAAAAETVLTPLHPDRYPYEALKAAEAANARPPLATAFPGAQSFYEVYVYFLHPVAHLLGWWASDAPNFGGLMRFILDMTPELGPLGVEEKDQRKEGSTAASATAGSTEARKRSGPSFIAQRLHFTNRLAALDTRVRQSFPAVRVPSAETGGSPHSSFTGSTTATETVETTLWQALTSFAITGDAYLGPPTILRYDHPNISSNVDVMEDPGVRTEKSVEIRWVDVRDRLRAQQERERRKRKTATDAEGEVDKVKSHKSNKHRSTRSAVLRSTKRCWPIHPIERVKTEGTSSSAYEAEIPPEEQAQLDLDDLPTHRTGSFTGWTLDRHIRPPSPPTLPASGTVDFQDDVFAFDAHRRTDSALSGTQQQQQQAEAEGSPTTPSPASSSSDGSRSSRSVSRARSVEEAHALAQQERAAATAAASTYTGPWAPVRGRTTVEVRGPGADGSSSSGRVETYEHILHRSTAAIATGLRGHLDASRVLLRSQRRKAIYAHASEAHVPFFEDARGYAQSVINDAGPAFGFVEGEQNNAERAFEPMPTAIFPPPRLLEIVRARVEPAGRAAGGGSAFAEWERCGYALELDRLQMVPSPPYVSFPHPRLGAGPMPSGPRWYPLIGPPRLPPWEQKQKEASRDGDGEGLSRSSKMGKRVARLDDWNEEVPARLDPASSEFDWDSINGLYAQTYGPHGIEIVYVRSRILTAADFDGGQEGGEGEGEGAERRRRWDPEPLLSADDMYVDQLIDRSAVRPGARVVEATKVTGDPNVPRGQVTWRAFVSDPRVRRRAWSPPKAGYRNHLPWPFVEMGLVAVAHGRVAGEGFAGAAWASAMVLIAPHEIRVWWQPMMKFAVARKLYGM
ncbi:unnamed protein product [Tilletia controversa]|uniref:F-box domain-containing protein n=1 Tax=Tilletia controversa TaxID=13291 RepID=A0A8X7MX37_9BASI|nr:hypothetical protein CF328_g2789 [Tilletia controversa]KAE8252563.1 hypothetical protein A4X06_0g2097 [Tilletia controversa]CAD6929853.1 unnamed protein product [Tilletia controversa]CAD6978063.1 unnamed protein product [Tilletia controversa]